MDFLVKRDDLHECRVTDSAAGELEPGQVRLEIESFGLTANNITYAVFGESMSYWDFFPAPEGWGRMPVWGFAGVRASKHDAVEEGTRVFGYLPPSTNLVVVPDRADEAGFVDSAPHRAKLPAVYNRYMLARADRRFEEQQMLLQPLVFTAFLLDADLGDKELFGAEAVVISSASSKTALATAFFLARRGGIELIGLTSPGRTSWVEGLGIYDRVVPYQDVDSLPTDRALYADISGDADLRAAVHRHYGEALAHSSSVGATHWDRMDRSDEDLPGPRPEFFFAPDVIKRRGGLGEEAGDAMRDAFEWSAGWLRVEHGRGPEAVERAYLEVLDGRTDPAVGHVLSLRT